jgi:hypothetical protein
MKSKLSEATEKTIKDRVNKYLKDNKLEGWQYRDAKVYKSFTIVYLTRNAQAKSYCKVCEKNHDKDNFLTLKITAKTITEQCLKKNFK